MTTFITPCVYQFIFLIVSEHEDFQLYRTWTRSMRTQRHGKLDTEKVCAMLILGSLCDWDGKNYVIYFFLQSDRYNLDVLIIGYQVGYYQSCGTRFIVL
uniref:Uncharacterized protein n=1 Tax=Lepeophtheirus salmonis TaxID=72036 RepID=A0A0K2TAF6_LEPSM